MVWTPGRHNHVWHQRSDSCMRYVSHVCSGTVQRPLCLVKSGDTCCRISRERDVLAEIYLGPWTFDKLDFVELALLGSISGGFKIKSKRVCLE